MGEWKQKSPIAERGSVMHIRSLHSIVALSLGLAGCGAAAGPHDEVPKAGVNGQSAASLFTEGQAAAERGDNVRAEQYLQLSIQRGYDRRVALPVLLSACVSSMHLRSALDHAESYLLEHPEDDGLRYLVATIRIGLGQKDDARIELERLLRRSPDDADAHFLLGVLYTDFDVAGAAEHLRRYLAIDPHGRRAAEAQNRLSDLAALPAVGADPRRALESPRSARR